MTLGRKLRWKQHFPTHSTLLYKLETAIKSTSISGMNTSQPPTMTWSKVYGIGLPIPPTWAGVLLDIHLRIYFAHNNVRFNS